MMRYCRSISGAFLLLGIALLVSLPACHSGAPVPTANNDTLTRTESLTPFGNRAAILFVSNPTGSNILAYEAPFTAPPFKKISTFPLTPFGLAVDHHGLLAVATNLNGQGYVNLYTLPWNGPPVQITNGLQGKAPALIAFDKFGRLFVTVEPDQVFVYAPPFSSASAPVLVLSKGIHCPQGLAFDSSGRLFISNLGGDCVTGLHFTIEEYLPQYVNGPIHEITKGLNLPTGLAFNHAGLLFVANAAGTVAIYKKPYTTPSVTLSAGIASPQQVAIDKTGALYIGNNGTGSVTEYNPPFTSSSSGVKTISGIFGLTGLAEYDP